MSWSSLGHIEAVQNHLHKWVLVYWKIKVTFGSDMVVLIEDLDFDTTHYVVLVGLLLSFKQIVGTVFVSVDVSIALLSCGIAATSGIWMLNWLEFGHGCVAECGCIDCCLWCDAVVHSFCFCGFVWLLLLSWPLKSSTLPMVYCLCRVIYKFRRVFWFIWLK